MIFEEMMRNEPLLVSILSWAVAQVIKVIIVLFATKKIDYGMLISSGGMPSSHSSFISALAAMVGFQEGFDSAVFAVAAVTCIIVMYDAAGVRRAAGQHAVIINAILDRVENDLNIKIDANLKELLGHTPIQVFAGGSLGIIIAACYILISK